MAHEILDERVKWILEAYRTQGVSNTRHLNKGFAAIKGGRHDSLFSPFQSGDAMFAQTFVEVEETK